MIIRNKYNTSCIICNADCPSGSGWAVMAENKTWSVYCDAHAPKMEKKVQRREITAEGEIYMPYEADNLPFIRSFPGARWNGEKGCWQVSLAQGDRIRVLELAIKLGLKIAPEIACIEVSKETEASKIKGLYNFQILGVDWLSKGHKRLLADEQGLGKTIQSLNALPKKGKVLIVCPASVKYNWLQEATKWRPDYKVEVLSAQDPFRFPKKNEILITSYNLLPEYFEPLENKEGNRWEIKINVNDKQIKEMSECILIADEVQLVKNYKTARSKRTKGLSYFCNKVWALSGTPLSNRPPDLFGVLDSLNMQYEVFHGWNNFARLMNGVRDSWGGYKWGMPDPSVPELMRRVMLRRMRQEVLPDLPDLTITQQIVDLPDELRNACDSMWNDWRDYLEAAMTNEKIPLPPFELFSALRAKLASSRIPILKELVEEHEENDIPLVVFSAHKEPIKEIGSRKGWGCITGDTPLKKRHAIVNQFQAGELVGIAATIGSAGVGLNMFRAWKAIFADLDWVPTNNDQAAKRLLRIGQTSSKVEIVQMVSNHVLDIHIRRLLNWKIGVAEAALNSVSIPSIPVQKEVFKAVETPTVPVKKPSNVSSGNWKGKIDKDPEIPF